LNRSERSDVTIEKNRLIMRGQLNDGYDGDKGLKYLTIAEIVNKGGEISWDESSLVLTNADEALILVSTSTDMMDKDYESTVVQLITEAKRESFDKLKQDHVDLYQEKFNRVELYLGEQDNITSTNQRLINFQENDDPAFAALYFQFGRYLSV
jgi:alpha-L-fucosidase 2